MPTCNVCKDDREVAYAVLDPNDGQRYVVVFPCPRCVPQTPPRPPFPDGKRGERQHGRKKAKEDQPC